MIAFELLVNGQRVCVAGTSRLTVVDAHWNFRNPDEISFGVSGIEVDDRGEGHVDWLTPAISVGDEITIRVIATDAVDKPITRPPESE